MHPAGFRKTSDCGMTPPVDFKSMLDLESREAFAASRMNHLPDPNRGGPKLTLAQDRLHIGPLILFRPTCHDRKVFFFDLSPFENHAKPPRRKRMLGHQDQAACITVQAVHNRRLPTIFHFESQQALNTAKQCRLGLTVGRMHNQGRWLVDHKPVGRLIDHRKIHHHLQAHSTKSHQPTPPRNLLLPHGTTQLQKKCQKPALADFWHLKF